MFRFSVFVTILNTWFLFTTYHCDVSSVCVPLAMMMTRMDEIKTMEKEYDVMKVKIR